MIRFTARCIRLLLLVCLLMTHSPAVPTEAYEGSPSNSSNANSGWILDDVDAPRFYVNLHVHNHAIDAEGVSHIAFGGDSLYYATQTAFGWQIEVVDDSPGAGGDAQLSLDGQGHPHILYSGVGGETAQYAHRDTTSWVIETVPNLRYIVNGNSMPAFTVDGSGNPHISYRVDEYLKYQHKSNGIWSVITVDTGGASYSSIALDSQNRPHISYMHGTNYDYALKYAYYTGYSWQKTVVDEGTHNWAGERNQIVVDSSNVPHIVYWDNGSNNLRYANKQYGYWTYVTIGSSISRECAAIALDSVGYPHVAYVKSTTLADSQVMHVWKTGDGFRTETVDWVDTEYTSLGVTPNDEPRIVTLEKGLGLVYYMQVYDAWSEMVLDDTLGAVGDNPSIAFDGEGHPHISYHEDTQYLYALKYAVYDGTNWRSETIDNQGFATGKHSSVATDSQNRPVIAYTGDRQLKLASYNGAGWSIESVDSDVNEYELSPSLALDSENHPHIAYSLDGGVRYAFYDGSVWQKHDWSPGQAPDMVLDHDDDPHLVFTTPYPSRTLVYAYREGGIWYQQTVPLAYTAPTRVHLALDSMNRPHVSFYDSSTYDLVYVWHNGSVWSASRVTTLSWLSGANAIVVDSTDSPNIAYYDEAHKCLQLATLDGMSWSLQTIDPSYGAGHSLDMDIDERNAPAIAYKQYITEDLRYAQSGGSTALAPDIATYFQSAQSQVTQVGLDVLAVSEVGDYFLKMLSEDAVRLIADTFFNSLKILNIDWTTADHGLSKVVGTNTYSNVEDTWGYWLDSRLADHWYQRVYFSIHHRTSLLWKETLLAGMRYWVTDAVGQVSQEWTSDQLSSFLGNELLAGIEEDVVSTLAGQPISDLGMQYASDFGRFSEDLITDLPRLYLSPEQERGYRIDLNLRRLANQEYVSLTSGHRDLLWETYQDRVADEAIWWRSWPLLLIKWGVVGSATLFWEGAGYYVASKASDLAEVIWTTFVDIRDLSADEHMVDQSLRFIENRALYTYDAIASNSLDAMVMIRNGDEPQIAEAQVGPVEFQSIGRTRFFPVEHWSENGSRIVVAITNTVTSETVFLTNAAYDHTKFFGGTQRLLTEGTALELVEGESEKAIIDLKTEEFGVSPDKGSQVTILVLGDTDTGTYPVLHAEMPWYPQHVMQIDNHGQPEVAAMAADMPTYPCPVIWSAHPIANTSDVQTYMSLYNPFTLTLNAVVTQTIPVGWDVVSVTPPVSDLLQPVWEAMLDPGSYTTYVVQLRCDCEPGTEHELPGPVVRLMDPATEAGDTYTTTARTVALDLPVVVESRLLRPLYSGAPSTVSFVISNTSTTREISGKFTAALSTANNMQLWESNVLLYLEPGDALNWTPTVVVHTIEPFAVLTASISLDGVLWPMVLESVVIKPQLVYLPIVSRQ